ncbi:hypothetical protein AAFF_G00139140 [Aldrovandia affinis]|uniref:Dual specificity phosphatase 29 n=1 Tax=Aldrovandia affinis TaxID=143900 RepID=A0AAD7TC62_9TELE|nr:hypothetical protein AAFF_G00139140 [Aldrovandia affinis]
MGVSRSATLVLAFLMIWKNLTLVEAINAVRSLCWQCTSPQETCVKTAHCAAQHDITDQKDPKEDERLRSGEGGPRWRLHHTRSLRAEKIFWRGSGAAYAHMNEVWPNVFIGDEKTALERHHLENIGVTHVLNAAEGKWNNVATGPDYYSDMNVSYYGVEAEDVPTFDLSEFFHPAAQFIHHALSKPENKLLVHCVMGRSRSATIFLAYLMIYKSMTVVEAIEHVKERRCILPNRGFLKQLRQLDIQLQQQKGGVKRGDRNDAKKESCEKDTQ